MHLRQLAAESVFHRCAVPDMFFRVPSAKLARRKRFIYLLYPAVDEVETEFAGIKIAKDESFIFICSGR